MLSTDRQTDRQTNRQTNATKNITSFAKEVKMDTQNVMIIILLGIIMDHHSVVLTLFNVQFLPNNCVINLKWA